MSDVRKDIQGVKELGECTEIEKSVSIAMVTNRQHYTITSVN